jgi:hypothetical protein
MWHCIKGNNGALTAIERLASEFLRWSKEDENALGVMQFCKRENIFYKDILQLNRDLTIHIDVYEKILGRQMEEWAKHLMCEGGETVTVNFFEMVHIWLGNRRSEGAMHFKYESKIAIKTGWLYDDKEKEIDEYRAGLSKIAPQKPVVTTRIVLNLNLNPTLPPETKPVAVLSAESVSKYDKFFTDLLAICRQEKTYSIVGAVEGLGLNYDNVKAIASKKKAWLDVLDDCHRYCFAWAEIAGLRRWLSQKKALMYMCENNVAFRDHLEWRKDWEDKKEKSWMQKNPTRESVTNKNEILLINKTSLPRPTQTVVRSLPSYRALTTQALPLRNNKKPLMPMPGLLQVQPVAPMQVYC